MKDILQNINILNDQIFEQQKELEKKIETEKKNFKKIKDENDLLKIEFNATQKSYDDIINETIAKQKKSEDKLSIAQLALNSKMKEINRKRDMLSKLYDPDLLVPIVGKNENKIDIIKDNLRKSSKLMKKTTFNNLFSDQYISSSTNENMLTTTSNNNNKKDNIKKMILKKSVSNVK